jgi:RNA polymerase sigma-70 factor (ECF subfamily)
MAGWVASRRRTDPRRIPAIFRNFSTLPASNTMSSVSGAKPEASPRADTPVRSLRPDIALLRKAQAGDRSAYGELVLIYQDRLFNAVLRIVGDRDEALELTQETFTRGLTKLDSFRGDAAPYSWLFRIAVNLAISQLRKVQRHRVFSLDRPGTGGATRAQNDDQASNLVDRLASEVKQPSQRAEQRERDEAVIAALGRLDAEYRAILVMRDIEGFDYQQMAELLALPLGTLKSRLFRARLALRDELRSYMGG